MIDRILGFLFGVVRGFILIVIPYMFYEAFFPDPNTHFPWVREAKIAALHQGHRRFAPLRARILPALLADGAARASSRRRRRPRSRNSRAHWKIGGATN